MAEEDPDFEFDVTPQNITDRSISGSFNIVDVTNRILMNMDEINRRLSNIQNKLKELTDMLSYRRKQ